MQLKALGRAVKGKLQMQDNVQFYLKQCAIILSVSDRDIARLLGFVEPQTQAQLITRASAKSGFTEVTIPVSIFNQLDLGVSAEGVAEAVYLHILHHDPGDATIKNLDAWGAQFPLFAEHHDPELWRYVSEKYQQDRNLQHFMRKLVQAQTLYFMQSGISANTDEANHYSDFSQPVTARANEVYCEVEVIESDCLDAAARLSQEGKRVLLLNMANQFRRGGGYSHGSGAQEEDLFRRTTLSASLNDNHYKATSAIDRMLGQRGKGIGEFGVLYSDNITVFRRGRDQGYAFMSEADMFDISVVSSAAYDLRTLASSVKPGTQQYIDGMQHKIRNQLRVAVQTRHRHLVLSAFGCGAFKNDPATVAQFYRDVLSEREFAGKFDLVQFAIYPNPGVANNANYHAFAQAFAGAAAQQAQQPPQPPQNHHVNPAPQPPSSPDSMPSSSDDDSQAQAGITKDDLLKVIKDAQLKHAKVCKRFSAWFFLHHHHGRRGIKRVENFYQRCEQACDVYALLKIVDEHLQHGKGNLNPSSFKTILMSQFMQCFSSRANLQQGDIANFGQELQAAVIAENNRVNVVPPAHT